MRDYGVIVAGSRDFNDYTLLDDTLHKFLKGFEAKEVTIISGTARGADTLGERFAYKYGCNLVRLPADWNQYGKSAGYRRNADMANIANACVVFWDGKSKGTKHMIDIAERKGLRLEVVIYG